MKPITDADTLTYLNATSGSKPITDPDQIAYLEHGVDFTKPENDVRKAIDALPAERRQPAIKAWAERAISRERASNPLPNLPQPAANLPFAKEAASGLNAGLYVVSGGKVGRPYDEGIAFERERARQQHVATPILDTAANLATGLALPVPAAAGTAGKRILQGMGVGGGYGALYGAADGEPGFVGRAESAAKGAGIGALLGGGLSSVAEGATMARRAYANQGAAGAAGKVAESLGQPVEAFADQVAAGAVPGNATLRRQTLDILGQEMEAAGGNVHVAQAAAISRLMREQGISQRTAAQRLRDLSSVHADSQLMLGEYPGVSESEAVLRGARGGRVQPQNVDVEALGRVHETPTQGLTDYIANNGNAPSAAMMRNAVLERQEQLAPSMRRTLGEVGPQTAGRPSTIEDAAQMIDVARQAGNAEYRAAYAAQTNNHALVNWLPRLLNRYDQMAATRSGEYGAAMRRASDQFYTNLPSGQRLAMSTLQQLQDARGAVRGQMNGYAVQGRNDLARVVRPLYDQITRLMEHANPTWGRANRRWADMRFMEMATELGDAFSTRAGPQFREQIRQFRQLAPEAQDIVRTHFLQKLYDKLDSLGDTHSVSKLFTSDHSRNMIRTLFGDRAVVDFARAVRDQKAAEMSQAMLRNSATHRRGVTQKQMDSETGLVAAVENMNARGARNFILDWATRLLTERRNRPMAEMLATPMSDAARVAQNITRMRVQQQRLQGLNQPPTWAPTAAALAGQSVGR